MAISALGYVCVGASDPDKWQRFACGVLGMQARHSEDGGLLLRCDDRDWRLRIDRGDEDDVTVLGWECASKREYDETLAVLRDVALPDPDLARARGVCGLATFTDPAGLRGELYWGPTERTDDPFVSPIGVAGFVTGDQGLGHIAVATLNVDEFVAFYLKIGMNISDYIDMRVGPNILPLTFLHCNSRHHTLAAGPAPSEKRCIHLMLQTRDLDDVGFSIDRAEQLGVPLAISLGRHSNDQMISVYFQSPSGIEFEYGWGARCIDSTWQVVRHDVISKWGHKFLGASHD